MVSPDTLESMHARLRQTVQSHGGEIKDIFFCPHRPEDACSCRKPEPGLIYAAQKKYRIDIATTCMIGDSAKDIECARRAGCGYAVLVKTGNGKTAQKLLAQKKIFPDHVARDLYHAAFWIIQTVRP
jgi:D-glycero-D-manno-heptose 1,7-bisphosphate phosphatase